MMEKLRRVVYPVAGLSWIAFGLLAGPFGGKLATWSGIVAGVGFLALSGRLELRLKRGRNLDSVDHVDQKHAGDVSRNVSRWRA